MYNLSEKCGEWMERDETVTYAPRPRGRELAAKSS